MRPFFTTLDAPHRTVDDESPVRDVPRVVSPSPASCPLAGRVAVYDDLAAAPRVDDVVSSEPASFIEHLSTATYSAARDCGGTIPFTVIREVVENLIHADFREIVVSVLDGGNTLRIADQGPGIPDKRRAVLPGFTTADARVKRFIRGVGSGLPIVSEFLSHQGGELELEDNLGTGTVVTLRFSAAAAPALEPATTGQQILAPPRLTVRQKRVLSLVLEYGEAGPTLVSKELAVGLSTAYRDLAFLEQNGLIQSDDAGKRVLTELGATYLDNLFE